MGLQIAERSGRKRIGLFLWMAAVAGMVAVAAACAAPKPTPTPTATPRPAPTATPLPAPTATPLPAPTATPTATPRPQPTPTATAIPTTAQRLRIAKNATPWVAEGYDGLSNPKVGGVIRVAGNQHGPHYDVQQEATCSWCIEMYGPRYDLLVRHREDRPAEIVPDLAERWEQSADGKVYTFYLRQGVKFHDGTDFNADDVIATYQRIAKPPEGVISTRTDWFKDVVSMEKLDAYTVRITLRQPLSYFMDYLSFGSMGINSKEFLEANKYNLRTIPTFPGTGPFKFKEVREGQSIEYERNPNYWNGALPFLDGFQHFKLDAVPAANAMLAGRIDELRQSTLPGYEVLKADSTVQLLPLPGLIAYYFWMNRNVKPFDDIRVRRALDMIWDRPSLWQASKQFRIYRQGDGWVPGGSTWEKELAGDAWKTRPGVRSVTEADVQEAKRLLKEAGYEKGLGEIEVGIRGPLVPVGMYHAQSLEASIQKYLGGGTTFKYVSVEFAAAKVELRENKRQTFSMASCFCEIDHPIIWFYSYWHSKGGNRLANFNDPEFDRTVEQMLTTVARQEQVRLGKQALGILYDKLPALPLYEWMSNMNAQKNYVKGTGMKDGSVDMQSGFRRDTNFLDK